MASLEEAVVSRAVAHTGLNDLISGRIYASMSIQDPTLPYLTFQRISATRNRTFGKRAQLVHARVQIDAFAASPESLVTLVAQVEEAFDNTTFGIVVDSALENELSDIDMLDTETQTARQTLDFVMTYTNQRYS